MYFARVVLIGFFDPDNIFSHLESAMDDPSLKPCTAFAGSRCFAAGPLREVALAFKARLGGDPNEAVLIFSDETGAVIDLDLRGTEEEILARLEPSPEPPRGRGRPRLGVVPREVTLLPRHWEWLNAQPGGASVTLRRLVEEARRAGSGRERVRLAQERTYRFMSVLGGDEPGYEEALRARYARDREAFETHTRHWPADVRDHTRRLAEPAFEEEQP